MNGKRVRQRQKPILVGKLTCKNKNDIFVKEINTSGYIVARTIYTLHTDWFALKHTFFTAQQRAYQSFLSYFLVGLCLHPSGMLGKY